MWSLTKLNFPFYDFYVIYYNFSKNYPKQTKKKKEKPLGETNQWTRPIVKEVK